MVGTKKIEKLLNQSFYVELGDADCTSQVQDGALCWICMGRNF